MNATDDFFSRYSTPIFFILLVLYGVLVFSQLLTVPDFFLDEGFKMQLARNVAESGFPGIQIAPGEVVLSLHNASTGWVLPAVLGMAFKLFGVSFFTARFVAVLFLLGFIALSWLFVRRTWGERTGLLSALLLMTFVPLFANGKMVLAEIPSLFFLAAGSLALFHWKPGTRASAAVSGLLFGLFASGKLAYVALFSIALLCALGYALLKRHVSVPYAMIFLLTFLLAVAPTGVLALLPLFSGSSGVVLSPDAYTNVYGAACSLCQIGKNLLAWLTDSTLLHLSVLLAAGLAAFLALVKRREGTTGKWATAAIALYIFGTIAYFLLSPLVYRYLLPVQVILLALFPPALLFASDSFPRFFDKRLAYGVIIALILVQGVHFARGSSLTSGDKAVLFEQYAREHIPATHSVGVINSSLAPVFVPNERMTQFFHFRPGNVIEGKHPLAVPESELPDFLIYERYDTYELDIAPYEPILASFYEQDTEFDGLFVFKKK